MTKYLKLLVATILSAVGLFLAFKGENLNELMHHFMLVEFSGVILACFLLIVSCIVRAFRWKLLMRPFDDISLNTAFGATMIGYFGNGIFAFRLGELLKAYYLTKKNDIKLMQAFGTVIIERILDIISVFVIFALLIPWFPFEDNYIRYGVFGFMGITMIIIFLLFLTVKYDWLKYLEKFKIFKSVYGRNILSSVYNLFDGLTILKHINNSMAILISSILLWFLYFIETMVLINACGLELGILDVGIIFFLGSIAIGIPALPGSVGTYDAGIKYSLMIVFNVASEKALNYAIVSHAVAYFPLTIIGFFYFLIGNVTMSELKQIEKAK